jgi:ankyrin repeat protein
MYAVLSGKAEMIKLLVEAGADPKVTDDEGKTAVDYAQDKGYTQIVALLNG